ncbi:MAG: hypothetical protein NTV14_01765, partial [Coprothermobacterota bacterium]|nr:hypothetical protein [Coprothermobacterota bacterium]
APLRHRTPCRGLFSSEQPAAAYQPAAVSSLQQSPLEQMEAELKEKAQDSAARKTQLQQRIEVCWNAGDGACVFAGS